VTGGGLASARDPLVGVQTAPTCDITMCAVVLVSRCTGAIDRDVVCDLLIECLQDVSFVTLALHLLVTCYLVSNFSFIFELGCFFGEGC
jgi:hypothetical protein